MKQGIATAIICAALSSTGLCAGTAANPAPETLRLDLTGDGTSDQVLLAFEGADAARLVLRTERGWHSLPWTVWRGGIGQQPALRHTPSGSIQVIAGNAAIGRYRWEETRTLAWREGQLQLAGYTYRWHDTLDPDAFGHCDLNLLTGRGFRQLGTDRSPIRHPPARINAADWDGTPPEICNAAR